MHSVPTVLRAAAPFLLLAPLAAQGLRVNGNLPHGEGWAASDVLGFQLSPDGQWAAFFADPDGDDRMELFGVPVGGAEAPRKLNGPLVEGGHLVEVDYYGTPPEPHFWDPWLAISAGNRVVYRGDQDTNGVLEFFSVPIDGSAPPFSLSGPAGRPNSPPACKLSPDGTRAVFFADPEDDDVFELFSAPLDGSASPVKLNGPLVAGGGFEPWYVDDLAISPDSQTAVYRLDAWTDGVFELFSAPLDGSASPVRLSAPPVAGGDLEYQSFHISSAGGRVVYVADAVQDQVYDAWSVPIDGSAAPTLLHSDALDAQVSPDGSRVVLQSGGEMLAVPIEGGPAVVLGGPLSPAGGSQVQDVGFSPDGARVVCSAYWETNQISDLFSVPIDGSSSPVKLDGSLAPEADVDEFVISPGGERVVYRANQDTVDVMELYSAPIDGGSAAVKLNGTLPSGADVSTFPRINADGSRVVFRADARVAGRFELWSVPIGGGVAPRRLNGRTVAGTDVPEELVWSGESVTFHHGYDLSAGLERAVYVADGRIDDLFALWSVPIDGSRLPTELSGELDAGPVHGDVARFAWADGGRRLLYSADQSEDQRFEVYSADLEPPPGGAWIARTRLGFGRVLLPSQDGKRVAFHWQPPCVYPYTPGCGTGGSLMLAPVDGSEPGVFANAGLGGNPYPFTLDSSGLHVVFNLDVWADLGGLGGLFSCAADGGPAISLTEPAGLLWMTGPGRVVISPDDGRVVYGWLDQLWSVPIDRSQPPVALTAPVDDRSPWFKSLQITSESDTVVFVADLEERGTFELFRVPVDGSALPVRLGPLLAPSGDVDPAFLLDSDGMAYYLADAIQDGVLDLWTIPLDPSRGSTPICLSTKPVPGGGVAPGVYSSAFDPIAEYRPQFALTPDGTRLVYRADQDIDGVFELYSVSSDGSAPAVKLNAPLAAGESVPAFGFRLHPDGSSVLYAAPDGDGVLRLHAVPIDAGAAPVALGGPFVAGGSLWISAYDAAALSFELTPDGATVVYLADQRTDGTVELFAAPSDGSADARALNGTLVPGGDVGSFEGSAPLFAISPDGSRVAYLADQEVDEVFELFVSYFDRPPVRLGIKPTRPMQR